MEQRGDIIHATSIFPAYVSPLFSLLLLVTLVNESTRNL